MPFSVSDYAHRSFDHLYAELCRAPAAALQRTTDAAGVALRVDCGPMLMSAPGVAIAHATWRTPDGALWLEGELRLLEVSQVPDPLTELLLVAETVVPAGDAPQRARWAHRLLAELADHIIEATPGPRAVHPPSRLLVTELARPGG